MTTTKIEWTDRVWNPVTGCTKVSAGCKNCYAEGVAHRFWGDRKFTDVRTHADRLDEPLRWRKPLRVFVNSMSDLFHDDVPDDFLRRVFASMAIVPECTFQVLTKRPERMRQFVAENNAESCLVAADEGRARGAFAVEPRLSFHARARLESTVVPRPSWPLPNVWLGVSVEDQRAAEERIPVLLRTPAAVRFLSCEPLLGPVDLNRRLYHSKRLHLRACVEGMLRNKSFSGLTDESGKALSRSQAEQRLRELLASGVRYLRVGDCDAFDPTTGCPGHVEPKVNWVIVGGESGLGARPCDVAWIRSIVEQCGVAGVACFVKQLGALPIADGKGVAGFTMGQLSGRDHGHGDAHCAIDLRDRKGGDQAEWPEDLRVRQFPEVR